MKKRIIQVLALIIVLFFLSYTVSAGCGCSVPQNTPTAEEVFAAQEAEKIDLKEQMLIPKNYFIGFYIWGRYIKQFAQKIKKSDQE